jgi:hypothetical protein
MVIYVVNFSMIYATRIKHHFKKKKKKKEKKFVYVGEVYNSRSVLILVTTYLASYQGFC